MNHFCKEKISGSKFSLHLMMIAFTVSSLLALQTPESFKVIGGFNTTEGEFPFAVSLQMKPVFGEGYHFCAGIIFVTENSQIIFTAGHCMYGRNWTQVQVVAGAHDLAKLNEPSQQRRKVKNVYFHPGFDPVTQSNDIAALILDLPLDLTTPHVKGAPVPSPDATPRYHENCTLVGWGSNLNPPSLSIMSTTSQLLQKVNMTIVPLPSCTTTYQHIKPINATTMICARGSNENKAEGPCKGDSGGPLICHETVTNRSVVAGIMSWSMIPCGNPSYPSVFMNLYEFVWS